jgi:hypothetical protein
MNIRRISRPTLVSRTLAAAWVYAPCTLLFYWERSPWMLLAITLAALSTAFGLARLFPHPAAAAPTHAPDHTALPSLNGLPPADTPFHLALAAAISAQACLLCLVADQPTFALLLCAIAFFLLAWRWSALDTVAADRWLGRRTPAAHAAAAVLLTAYALLWGTGTAGSPGRAASAAAATTPKPSPEYRDSSNGYYGIILWPPPKKAVMVDPVLSPDASASGRMAKPLLIPFDGPYWFFKAPNNSPSPRAHVAHANPTDVNIRSTDFEPLMMEAHQSLSQPIDLDCCGQINVALTNADTRSGEINIGLLLTDATNPTSSNPPQLFLGVNPLASSQPDLIPQDRPPVHETLHFAIPAASTLHRFNQITVLFLPTQGRARNAAKVSVESFELIPRL